MLLSSKSYSILEAVAPIVADIISDTPDNVGLFLSNSIVHSSTACTEGYKVSFIVVKSVALLLTSSGVNPRAYSAPISPGVGHVITGFKGSVLSTPSPLTVSTPPPVISSNVAKVPVLLGIVNTAPIVGFSKIL